MPTWKLFFILLTMAISWSLSFANSPSRADTAEQANRKALYKGQLLLLNEQIKEKPTEPKLLLARASVNYILGNAEEAETDFALAEAFKGDIDYSVLISRGSNYINLKKYPDAIATLTKAIAEKPNSWVAIANRGAAYYEAGQYREALTDSFKAIRLNSRGSCPHAVIGACYLKNQQYGYAMQYLNLALSRQPKNFEALHFRGELYQKLGKPTLAAADFATANAAGYAPGKFFDEPAN